MQNQLHRECILRPTLSDTAMKVITGLIGKCGSRNVFLGLAPASLLHRISIADVLDEASTSGYQRRFNRRHSLDFRKYIQGEGATTIPLTFNLRPRTDGAWEITTGTNRSAKLRLDLSKSNLLYQVDCQHRLGFLHDEEIEFAFMTFIGLNQKEEMEVFSTINAKAMGLSTSLLDYHVIQLAKDLETERPELFIALRLNEDDLSPWYQQLDLGGNATSGLKRRASLRTLQKAVKRFLGQSDCLETKVVHEAYEIVRSFWVAVAEVLPDQWANPRKHFLTKGIGVYALSTMLSDLYRESQQCSDIKKWDDYFVGKLSDFVEDLDWSTTGPLRGLGGETGARAATDMLRTLRIEKKTRAISNG